MIFNDEKETLPDGQKPSPLSEFNILAGGRICTPAACLERACEHLQSHTKQLEHHPSSTGLIVINVIQ